MRINWPAITLAAVVHWLFGAVWFTVFAKPWQAGLRMSPEELQGYISHPNYWPYIISFICSLVIAYVIARWVGVYDKHRLFHGISVGILVGLAAALAMVTEMVFEMRSRPFMLISALYPLIGCVLMGIVIGVWRPKARSVLDVSRKRLPR